MKISRETAPEQQLINGYGSGGFKIAGVRHEGSVIVLPERTLPWPAGDNGQFDMEGLAALAEASPPVELLVLGFGASFALVPPQLRMALKQAGMACEGMATPAACRTFNILLTENRRVAAALVAVD